MQSRHAEPTLRVPGLNESPRPKAGKCHAAPANGTRRGRLNESPHPKAKKSESRSFKHTGTACASMKVPTRRRGNNQPANEATQHQCYLNESPHPRGRKFAACGVIRAAPMPTSKKVPTRKRGNVGDRVPVKAALNPSMKVPTRRRGNLGTPERVPAVDLAASMKVPTRRWRNQRPSSPLRLRR